MEPQQIQELVVCSAAVAAGAMLLFLDPESLPDPIGSFAKSLGRARKVIAVIIIVSGLGILASNV